MPSQSSILDVLRGTWTGTGHAEYPTIDSAEYCEELTFTSDGKHPILHFEQRTWKVVQGANADPLFWESGFLVGKKDGTFEMASSQQSGRMELLHGTARPGKDGEVILELDSKAIVNDERMKKTQRIILIKQDTLSYVLNMSTTAVPDLKLHASANLTRKK